MNTYEANELIKDLSIDAWGEEILRKKSSLTECYYQRTIFCCVLLILEIILMITSAFTLFEILIRISFYLLLATVLAQLYIYHIYVNGCDKIFEEQMDYFKSRFTNLKKLERGFLPVMITDHATTKTKP